MPDDDGEHVVIDGACPHVRRWARGLEVVVQVVQRSWHVSGPDLHAFLARMDPDVWDPLRAKGDA